MKRRFRIPRRPRPTVVARFRWPRVWGWRLSGDDRSASAWRLHDARLLRMAVMRTRPLVGPLPGIDPVRPGVSVLRRWRAQP